MATSEQQRRYNQKYRDKQRKIKAHTKDLDEAVRALEDLPPCPECAAVNRLLGRFKNACRHTPWRKRLHLEAELHRGRLQELEPTIL